MPYPDRPYRVAAIATYVGGVEHELVEYGDPCTHEIEIESSDRGRRSALLCGALPSYLQGGVPRCKSHLSWLCVHGEYSHPSCDEYFPPISVRRLRHPRPQTS